MQVPLAEAVTLIPTPQVNNTRQENIDRLLVNEIELFKKQTQCEDAYL